MSTSCRVPHSSRYITEPAVARTLLEFSYHVGQRTGLEVVINFADLLGIACLVSVQPARNRILAKGEGSSILRILRRDQVSRLSRFLSPLNMLPLPCVAKCRQSATLICSRD